MKSTRGHEVVCREKKAGPNHRNIKHSQRGGISGKEGILRDVVRETKKNGRGDDFKNYIGLQSQMSGKSVKKKAEK